MQGIDFILPALPAVCKLRVMDRAIVLGASRGLGAELVKQICATTLPLVGFGRKEEPLALLRDRFPLFEYQTADFSTPRGQDETLRYLSDESYSKLFYVAGGGPFGPFEKREWKDHQWAWEVSFLFPARIVHSLLKAKLFPQIILVGSSVAETGPDPLAASYCAAKHALKGLYLSLAAENPTLDIRLFSPGYMDTELLPKNAAVRQHGVYSPAQLAQELWTWSLTGERSGHRVYAKHPS